MSELPLLVSLVLLAVIQGVTEFLPISSSGHLALGQLLLGVGEGSLIEDIVMHLGTLVAVVVFYRADIGRLVLGGLGRGAEVGDSRRYIGWILLGNVPAGVVGVFFKDSIEGLFDSPVAVLAAMAATAVMLAATRAVPRRDRALTARIALLVGIAQAVAILPGASRSGWTIATALFLGLKPAEAARFSFLLSIPAIAGAALLQFTDLEGVSLPVGPLLAAFVTAALVGILCLRWLVALVRRMALHLFAWYLLALVVVGAVVLAVGGGQDVQAPVLGP